MSGEITQLPKHNTRLKLPIYQISLRIEPLALEGFGVDEQIGLVTTSRPIERTPADRVGEFVVMAEEVQPRTHGGSTSLITVLPASIRRPAGETASAPRG
jgi:hypothetical protein